MLTELRTNKLTIDNVECILTANEQLLTLISTDTDEWNVTCVLDILTLATTGDVENIHDLVSSCFLENVALMFRAEVLEMYEEATKHRDEVENLFKMVQDIQSTFGLDIIPTYECFYQTEIDLYREPMMDLMRSLNE